MTTNYDHWQALTLDPTIKSKRDLSLAIDRVFNLLGQSQPKPEVKTHIRKYCIAHFETRMAQQSESLRRQARPARLAVGKPPKALPRPQATKQARLRGIRIEKPDTKECELVGPTPPTQVVALVPAAVVNRLASSTERQRLTEPECNGDGEMGVEEILAELVKARTSGHKYHPPPTSAPIIAATRICSEPCMATAEPIVGIQAVLTDPIPLEVVVTQVTEEAKADDSNATEPEHVTGKDSKIPVATPIESALPLAVVVATNVARVPPMLGEVSEFRGPLIAAMDGTEPRLGTSSRARRQRRNRQDMRARMRAATMSGGEPVPLVVERIEHVKWWCNPIRAFKNWYKARRTSQELREQVVDPAVDALGARFIAAICDDSLPAPGDGTLKTYRPKKLHVIRQADEWIKFHDEVRGSEGADELRRISAVNARTVDDVRRYVSRPDYAPTALDVFVAGAYHTCCQRFHGHTQTGLPEDRTDNRMAIREAVLRYHSNCYDNKKLPDQVSPLTPAELNLAVQTVTTLVMFLPSYAVHVSKQIFASGALADYKQSLLPLSERIQGDGAIIQAPRGAALCSTPSGVPSA